MPGALQAVLFDLDGTLVDSLGDITDGVNHVLAAAGHPIHDATTVATMVGDGAAKLVERAAPPSADVPALLAALKVYYGAHAVDRTRPFAGVLPLLDGCKAAGMQLAVLSNKPEPMVHTVVDALFAPSTFAVSAGQRADRPKKPDPTYALEIAERLGVPPAACAFVGDSPVDVQTAHAAGMLAVAVTWGFRSRAQLEPDRPAHVVDTVEALRGVLLG